MDPPTALLHQKNLLDVSSDELSPPMSFISAGAGACTSRLVAVCDRLTLLASGRKLFALYHPLGTKSYKQTSSSRSDVDVSTEAQIKGKRGALVSDPLSLGQVMQTCLFESTSEIESIDAIVSGSVSALSSENSTSSPVDKRQIRIACVDATGFAMLGEWLYTAIQDEGKRPMTHYSHGIMTCCIQSTTVLDNVTESGWGGIRLLSHTIPSAVIVHTFSRTLTTISLSDYADQIAEDNNNPTCNLQHSSGRLMASPTALCTRRGSEKSSDGSVICVAESNFVSVWKCTFAEKNLSCRLVCRIPGPSLTMNRSGLIYAIDMDDNILAFAGENSTVLVYRLYDDEGEHKMVSKAKNDKYRLIGRWQAPAKYQVSGLKLCAKFGLCFACGTDNEVLCGRWVDEVTACRNQDKQRTKRAKSIAPVSEELCDEATLSFRERNRITQSKPTNDTGSSVHKRTRTCHNAIDSNGSDAKAARRRSAGGGGGTGRSINKGGFTGDQQSLPNGGMSYDVNPALGELPDARPSLHGSGGNTLAGKAPARIQLNYSSGFRGASKWIGFDVDMQHMHANASDVISGDSQSISQPIPGDVSLAIVAMTDNGYFYYVSEAQRMDILTATMSASGEKSTEI